MIAQTPRPADYSEPMKKNSESDDGIPLQKWIQWSGWGTKIAARTMIREGRVTVDGQVCTRYAFPILGHEEIRIDGEPLPQHERVVIAMFKPKKHITAIDDDHQGREALGRYLPKDCPPVFPVGRLDYNTEGLLLFTNDGRLARKILHPSEHVEKVYRVKIRGHIEDTDPGLERMRAGMTVGNAKYRPVKARVDVLRTRATWVELVLTEGKFRQIRKMCRAGGFQIVKLHRVAIGPVEIGDLRPRTCRVLSSDEVDELCEAVGLIQNAS